MRLLQFLKPAPNLEEIQDETVVKKTYRYWRLRTFLAMYVGYAFYYFTRKSFTFAMPVMHDQLGMDKMQLGTLASILSLTYGASKFLSGIIADKSSPRYFMSIGLILTGVCNLLFGASSIWVLFAVFWGINGLFQGWGATCCAKLMTHWYSQSERGRWWSFWSTSHNLGGALIPIVAAFCVNHFGWRYAMFIPGTICIVIGFLLIVLMRDTPQSLGLPSVEKFRNDYTASSKNEETGEVSAKQILFDYVLCNKFIWMLAIAYFFVYVIRTGLNDWMMMYLKEIKNYSSLVAGSCIIWFEVGGCFGTLLAGWGSDILFKGKRTPINVIFTVGVLLSIAGFRMMMTTAYTPVLDSFYIALFGFFIFGPQMLIGLACAELVHKKAVATANGFAGCFGYLGAAAAGGPLGAITEVWGWNSFFTTMVGCSVVAILCMLPLWSLRSSPELEQTQS